MNESWVDASARVYRHLLRAYPRAFRDRYGQHALDLFEDRCRDAVRQSGMWGFAWHWVGSVYDLTSNALSERFNTLRTNLRSRDTPPYKARHAVKSGGTMSALLKDVRYAIRMFAKQPAFTFIAVATLGLGIGANSAIFSVVRAVLLAPLPYEDPDRLAVMWGELTTRNITHFPFSPPDYRDFRNATSFETLAAFSSFGGAISGDGEAEQVQVGFITENFFSTLGVRPMLGRDLTTEDATPFNPGADPNATPPTSAIILSHGLWQRRYGGDPNVLGRTLQLAGGPGVVVGIMPAGFRLHLPPTANQTTNIDLWTAARLDYDNSPRGNVFLIVLGRLANGVTLEQAQGEVDAIAARVRDEYQGWVTSGFRARLEPLQEDLTRQIRPTVLALLGAVGFVLLIACANVANLLLVRATARTREISIRAALGGSRSRIVRQMLIESVVLASLGGILGIALAQLGVRAVIALQPADLPRIDSVSIDGLVLAFTGLVSLGAALVFGTLPALQASRTNVPTALSGRSGLGGAAWQRRVRNAMVVIEVALSLVLLIGTGLMVRSSAALQRVNPGFDPTGVLTFQVPLPFFAFPQPAQRHAFETQLRERFAGLPGVTHVAGAFTLPLSGQAFNGRYGTATALEDEREFRQADYRGVIPGYFDAMGTRVIEGRGFTLSDEADSLPVVLVDEVLARKTWPGESAVGKRLVVRVTSTEPEWVDVIGVVEHQRHASLSTEGRETVYFTSRFIGSFGVTWVLRTESEPLGLTNAVRASVADLDANVPVSNVRLMKSYVDEARAPTQFALVLIGVFGFLALILASIGLYGVLAYAVRQRTAEIGVRMAFGASTRGILRLVVMQGMGLAVIGLGIGIVAAFALTRVMSTMLVGVSPTDPVTFIGISVIFLGVALAACLIPARRATHVDPIVALRTE